MDIYLINGNFQIGNNGDLRILDESQTLKQDVYNRLRTIKGSHFLHENYGVDLIEFVNAGGDNLTVLELANEIEEQLEEDPRIYEVEVEIKEQTLEGIKLKINVYPLEDAPFSLEIDKQDVRFIAEARE